LSASGNAFLSKPFSAAKMYEVYCSTICVSSATRNIFQLRVYWKILQKNLVRVSKRTISKDTRSISWKTTGSLLDKSQTGNEMCRQKGNWKMLVLGLKI